MQRFTKTLHKVVLTSLRREETKGQNCSVPLRYTPQFFQIVYATLSRRVKTLPPSRDKKARPRLRVKSIAKGKHGHHPNGHYPLPVSFTQAYSKRRTRRPCFQHFPQTVTPAFLAPPLPAWYKRSRITAQKTPAPRP
jgi:hypothetical protein